MTMTLSAALVVFLVASFADAWILTRKPLQTGNHPRRFATTKNINPTAATSTRLHMGAVKSVSNVARRVRDSLTSKERSREDLKIGIAGFYDRSSQLWEDVWGEHMHHGYYVPANRTDHQQAQVDLIDEVLKWSQVVPGNVKSAVDVGCGIGGSSRK